MAQEVTQIVVPFWPRRLFEPNSNSGPILAPSVYLNQTQIMALPWAIPESERKVAQKQTKYHVTTIKRALDALAVNRSLVMPLCPTTNEPMTYDSLESL